MDGVPAEDQENGWGFLPAAVLARLASVLDANAQHNDTIPWVSPYLKTFGKIRQVNKHWYSCVNASWTYLELSGHGDCCMSLLPKFPHLQTLDMLNIKQRSHFNGQSWEMEVRDFGNLGKLKSLAHLRVANLIAPEILAIPKLKSLAVYYSVNADSCKSLFRECVCLEKLSLEFACPVDPSVLKGIEAMHDLVSLDLVFEGKPQNFDLRSLAFLTKLTQLLVDRCLSGPPATNALDFLPNIVEARDLTISRCRIQDESMTALESLTKLTSLNLSSTFDFEGSGLIALSRMVDLENLCLAHSSLLGIYLKHLEALPCLARLNLNSCNWITDEKLCELTKIRSLRLLDIKWCEWVDGRCLEKLSGLSTLVVNFENHMDHYAGLLL